MPFDIGRIARHPLVLGLALLYAWQGFFLVQGLFVVGDSLQAYAFFNTVLGNLQAAGEFPLWLPHTAWGVPAMPYLLTFLGPCQVFAALAGAVLGLQNAWGLFVLSVLLESSLFVASCWLLARDCLRQPLARSAVTAGAALTVYWHVQFFWPHKAVLLLPLALHLLIRFQAEGDWRRLWQCGAVAVAWLLGNLAYLAPILALSGLVFMAALALFSRRLPPVTRAGFLAPGALAWFLGCAVLAGLYAWFLAGSLEGLVLTAPGREAGTSLPLAVFLDYGYPALARVPEFFIGAAMFDVEMNVYLGVAAAALMLSAWPLARDPRLAALGVLGGFLLLLSLGRFGGVAWLAYWFPLADRFRHLGHLLPLVRLLLLFVAGFGLEALASRDKAGPDAGPDAGGDADARGAEDARAGIRERIRADWKAFALRAGLCAAVFLAVKWLLFTDFASTPYSGLAPEAGTAGLALGLALARVRGWGGRGLALVACAALFLDLGASQYTFFCAPDTRLATWTAGQAPHAVRLPTHSARRMADPRTEPRWPEAVDMAVNRGPVNTSAFSFLGLDPCVPFFRTDYVCRSVAQWGGERLLAALRAANRESDPRRQLDAVAWRAFLADPGFMAAAGCAAPWLGFGPGSPGAPLQDASRRITHFSANRVRLDLEVQDPAGGRLHHADAFHPGWRAQVDGRPAPLDISGGAFKGLAVPPGRHAVELEFSTRTQGWLLAALGLGALMTVLLVLAERPDRQSAWKNRRD